MRNRLIALWTAALLLLAPVAGLVPTAQAAPVLTTTPATGPRIPVLSDAGTLSCTPGTPGCVCTGPRCRIVVTPVVPGDPGDPGRPGIPAPGPGLPGPGPTPGDPGDEPPPPIVLPPPGEIWEPCAIGQTPPPGFVCPTDPIPVDPANPDPPPLPDPPSQAEIMQLVAELNLPDPEIGSAPCSGSGCMGAVGLPVWLWTQPWQTYTDTAVIRIYEITLTATPIQVDWSMGDGSVVTCTNAGTPYLVGYGVTDSPTCGYKYMRTSDNQPGLAYTLGATMTYQVTWSGVVSGQTTTTTTQNTPVRIGEIQTVINYQD